MNWVLCRADGQSIADLRPLYSGGYGDLIERAEEDGLIEIPGSQKDGSPLAPRWKQRGIVILPEGNLPASKQGWV